MELACLPPAIERNLPLTRTTRLACDAVGVSVSEKFPLGGCHSSCLDSLDDRGVVYTVSDSDGSEEDVLNWLQRQSPIQRG